MAINKPEHHLFVCNSFRLGGDPKGVCNKKGTLNLMQYLENEILDRGLDAMVTSTGCLKICEKGPVMICQPQNAWYGEMDEEKIDEVLDSLEEGEVCEAHQIA